MPGLFKKKIDFDTYELPEPEKEDYVSEDSEAEEIDSVMLSMKGLFTYFPLYCLFRVVFKKFDNMSKIM